MATPSFQRTRLTWLLYFMLAWFAYLEGALNPIMPHLRRDLTLSFTVGSLHTSAFAFGIILGGLFGDRVANRFGTGNTLWGGAFGMAIGTGFLATGQIALVTIGGAFLMGALGSLVMVVAQSSLSQLHGDHRAIALMEANILTSVLSSFSPMLVGLFITIAVGWQMALWVMVGLLVVLFAIGRLEPLPQNAPTPPNNQADGRLPRVFWLYALVNFLGVGIEWCIWLWGADYLISHAQFEPALASAMITFFTVAAVIGRLVSSRLLRTRPPHHLLPIALIIVGVGFPIFWLATIPLLNVVGLFVVGLGAGNLFPLSLGAALNTAPSLPNQASARLSLATGFAILVSPFILGVLADNIGIQPAYGVVIVLGILAMSITLRANHLLDTR